MRLHAFFLALSGPLLTLASSPLSDSRTVYLQPLSSTILPVPLADISYNPSTLLASISSYYPPSPDYDSESEDDITPPSHLKIGTYDRATNTWKSSTSLTSANTFEKGYRPTFVLTLDAQGEVLGVSVSAGKIDAGATREFGPAVLVRGMGKAKGPVLNKPVVLSPEGKMAVPEVEKSMLQK
jgi:hypothetical protein